MSEIKYEAVFGDQSLFDGAPENAVLSVHIKRFGVEHYSDIQAAIIKAFQLSSTEVLSVAMRRIIQEPKRWTMQDKLAGRLPEVGSMIWFINDMKQVEFAGTDGGDYLWYFKRDSGAFGSAYFNCFKPIETPEEKAQREREEWKNNVIAIHHGKRRKMSTSTFLLDDIYDALLSGELTAPKGGE